MSTENLEIIPELELLSYSDEVEARSELDYIDYIEQELAKEGNS